MKDKKIKTPSSSENALKLLSSLKRLIDDFEFNFGLLPDYASHLNIDQQEFLKGELKALNTNIELYLGFLETPKNQRKHFNTSDQNQKSQLLITQRDANKIEIMIVSSPSDIKA